jgi:hypothetical protein
MRVFTVLLIFAMLLVLSFAKEGDEKGIFSVQN